MQKSHSCWRNMAQYGNKVMKKRFDQLVQVHLAILIRTSIPYSTHIPGKSAISAILGGYTALFSERLLHFLLLGGYD